jgi:hypothetical protein
VGNENTALFWTDCWILGRSIESLVPLVSAQVPLRAKKTRTVAAALNNDTWVTDIQGGLSWLCMVQLLQLWDKIRECSLNDLEDQHIWRLEANGSSSKSAYRAFFLESITFEPWKRIWILEDMGIIQV